jgi:hypothetical protein
MDVEIFLECLQVAFQLVVEPGAVSIALHTGCHPVIFYLDLKLLPAGDLLQALEERVVRAAASVLLEGFEPVDFYIFPSDTCSCWWG